MEITIAQENIKLKQKILDADINARSKVYYHSSSDQDEKTTHLNMITEKLTGVYNQQKITQITSQNLTKDEEQRDHAIQKQCEHDLKEKSINLAFKVLSFVGMCLLAAAPFFPPVALPLFLTGLACVTVVSIFYNVRTIKQIKDMFQARAQSTAQDHPSTKLSSNPHSFFSPVKEEEDNKIFDQSAALMFA